MNIHHKHIYHAPSTYTDTQRNGGHGFLNFIHYFVCVYMGPCMSKYACRSQKTTSQSQFSPFTIWGIELRSSNLTTGPEPISTYLFIFTGVATCHNARLSGIRSLPWNSAWQQVSLHTEPSHQPLLFGREQSIFYFKNYYFYVVCAWFACMHIYAPHHACCSHRLEEAAESLGTGVIVLVIATVQVLRSKAMSSARAISAVWSLSHLSSPWGRDFFF